MVRVKVNLEGWCTPKSSINHLTIRHIKPSIYAYSAPQTRRDAEESITIASSVQKKANNPHPWSHLGSMDHQRCRGADQKRPSLLQGDEFFHKMLSRNSSVGCSSRIYYRCPEGVPFQWEMQPGTPKHPQKEDVMPPLSPPPAVLSLGLPKPCIEQPKAQTWPRLRFWNKSKKSKERENVKAGPRGNQYYGPGSSKSEISEFCGSDSEFGASPRISSSSSSSLSFSNGPSLQSSRSRSPGRDSFRGPFSCSPWNFNSILVSISRRVW